MILAFDNILVGSAYSRNELANLWGYAGYQALARGVVTPKDDFKIILFVTAEKQASLEQYRDELDGKRLKWEGPNDHFAEERMINAAANGEEIHLFYRDKHHSDFTYYGQIALVEYQLFENSPSRFVFAL